ncbi:hypothetical protein MMC32_006443 [Xylographa parallela]|nr:hypothetical protein [Xylographa parallela]
MDESPGKMYALGAVLSLMAIVVVPLRFYARYHHRTPFGWDDYMTIPALLFTVLTGICIIIGASLGDLGGHTLVVDGVAAPDARTVIFQKVSYWTLLTQTLTFGFTKLAVLLFYKRIFRGSLFTVVVWTMIVITIIWTVAFFFANLLQCIPIWINWTGEGVTAENCIDETTMYLAQAWSDVFTDVAILSIPLPLVWNLHMPTARKIGLTCIFLLGALVVAAGVAKLVIFHAIAYGPELYAANFPLVPSNVSRSDFLTPVLYWPMVESSLGLLGACLPTYRPLFAGVSLESVVASIRSIVSLQSLGSDRSRINSQYQRHDDETGSQSSTAGVVSKEAAESGSGAM